jgi:hypothetical protein
MALFGRKTVIVPLGIGCQTAHQLGAHEVLIAELAGEVFAQATTPFDWRLVGPSDVERMIAEDEFYPSRVGELTNSKRPYWARRKCHFWHDPAGRFDNFVTKQEHLRDTWERIHGFPRKVFVLSGLQNNLALKSETAGQFEHRLHTWPVVSLAHMLGRRFERPELHVVARKDRFDGLDLLDHQARELKGVKLGVHFVDADKTSWQGADHIWAGTLERIIRGAK